MKLAQINDEGFLTSFSDVPEPVEGFFEISEEQYAQCLVAFPNPLRWVEGEFVVVELPPVEPTPRLVPRRLIIDRLHAAGKLEAADTALKAADLYTRQRWETRDAIYFNDPTAIQILTIIGADPDAILAE